MRPLELESFQALIQDCIPPQRMLAMLILHTGCRVSEALSVNIEQVRRALVLKKKMIDINSLKQKRKTKRPLYLSDTLIKELDAYCSTWNKRRTGPLITDKYGTPGLHRKNAYVWIKQIMEAIGREDLSPHSLRHTAGKTLLRKGMSLNNIQKFLGHSSMASTGVYLEADDEDIIKGIETAF